MNKYFNATLTGLLLLSVGPSASFASSTVNLKAQNDIGPQSEFNLPLEGLLNDVPFIVSCELHSQSAKSLDIQIAPKLSKNSGFGVTKINETAAPQNMGALKSGKNKLSFLVSVAENKDGKTNVINVKNLDRQYSVAINNCQALPANNVTSAANKVGGDYFFISNHLPYFADVTVGNFFPTEFCIPPFSRLYVQTSTHDQNIDIIRTHY